MSIAQWPLPMITAETMDQDWFGSITEKLMWNTMIKRSPRDIRRQVPLAHTTLCAALLAVYHLLSLPRLAMQEDVDN
jgi:hypothetical protein